MHYQVHVFGTGEDHTFKSIPALLKFMNANRGKKKGTKGRPARNVGPKSLKKIFAGNGVFENTMRITKVTKKGKETSSPAAEPAAASIPPSEMVQGEKPLPFKVRRSKKKMVNEEKKYDTVVAPDTVVEKVKGNVSATSTSGRSVILPSPSKSTSPRKRNVSRLAQGRLKKKIVGLITSFRDGKIKDKQTLKMNLQSILKSFRSTSPHSKAVALLKAADSLDMNMRDLLRQLRRGFGHDDGSVSTTASSKSDRKPKPDLPTPKVEQVSVDVKPDVAESKITGDDDIDMDEEDKRTIVPIEVKSTDEDAQPYTDLPDNISELTDDASYQSDLFEFDDQLSSAILATVSSVSTPSGNREDIRRLDEEIEQRLRNVEDAVQRQQTAEFELEEIRRRREAMGQRSIVSPSISSMSQSERSRLSSPQTFSDAMMSLDASSASSIPPSELAQSVQNDLESIISSPSSAISRVSASDDSYFIDIIQTIQTAQQEADNAYAQAVADAFAESDLPQARPIDTVGGPASGTTSLQIPTRPMGYEELSNMLNLPLAMVSDPARIDPTGEDNTLEMTQIEPSVVNVDPAEGGPPVRMLEGDARNQRRLEAMFDPDMEELVQSEGLEAQRTWDEAMQERDLAAEDVPIVQDQGRVRPTVEERRAAQRTEFPIEANDQPAEEDRAIRDMLRVYDERLQDPNGSVNYDTIAAMEFMRTWLNSRGPRTNTATPNLYHYDRVRRNIQQGVPINSGVPFALRAAQMASLEGNILMAIQRSPYLSDRDEPQIRRFVGRGVDTNEKDGSPDAIPVTTMGKDDPAMEPVEPTMADLYPLPETSLMALGRNNPEDYYTLRVGLTTVKTLPEFLKLCRDFSLRTFRRSQVADVMSNNLLEVYQANRTNPEQYFKYVIHVLFYILKYKLKLPVNELRKIETALAQASRRFAGAPMEVEDNVVVSHIRLMVNEALGRNLQDEPLVSDELLRGAGQLDSIEAGLTTLRRTTDNMQLEKVKVAQRRMHRSHRRGQVLYEPGKSNLWTQTRLAPFKAPLDPEMRRPQLTQARQLQRVTRVPRISTVKVGAPEQVSVPQTTLQDVAVARQTQNLAEGRSPFDNGEVPGPNFQELINRAFMNRPDYIRPPMQGRGADNQASLRRRRGITLFTDDTSERRAHKRLRSSFTLNMYNER